MARNHMFIRQWATKLELIKMKGGNCVTCGINLIENPWRADFHHIGEKDLDIATMMREKRESLHEEILKCSLLCANCHRDKHALIDKFHSLRDKIDTYSPSNVKKWSSEDTKLLLKLHKDGLSNKKISKLMNRDKTTIDKRIKKLNLKCNGSHVPHKNIDINKVAILKNQGLNNTKIAKALGCCRQQIDRMVKRLPSRELQPA